MIVRHKDGAREVEVEKGCKKTVTEGGGSRTTRKIREEEEMAPGYFSKRFVHEAPSRPLHPPWTNGHSAN